MRIFLDANVLFSAAKSDGAMRRLLHDLRRRDHELWADAYVLEEARRNLALKSPAAVPALETLMAQVHLAPMSVSGKRAIPLPLPDKDRPVLDAAIRTGCDILVTGDRTHFGRLYGTAIEGVEVLAPATLAERLL
jgi:uncharacterized protein